MLGGWDKGGANAWANYYDKAAVIFRDALYVGSVNDTNGGEIWQMLKRTFLPLIRRSTDDVQSNRQRLSGPTDAGRGRYIAATPRRSPTGPTGS